MRNKKNVPAIRFRGFSCDWKSRRFDKTFSILSNNTLSRAELNYENGSTKNVHYGDILIKFGECINVAREDIPYISDEKIAVKYRASRLQEGDIVFADTAEDTTAGKCTEFFNINEQPIISGLHTIPCHPLFPFSTGYLGYYLNSPAYHNQLLPLMQGTKVVGISKTAMRDTNISFPDDTDEQKSIGNYFQNIDKLISTSQTKLNKLKNIKKSCLDKMFPKNGSKTPELRFKGFEEMWQKAMFEENIISIQTGTNLLGNAKNNGIPLLKMGNIQRGFFSLDKLEYLDERTEIELENVANYGDFFFNTRNTLELVGKGATWTGESGKFAFNSNIARFKFKGIDTIFYNYLYNTNSVILQVRARAMGTTSVAAIYPDNLNSITYNLPHITEQKVIGEFFKNIDDLIVKTEQQLNKLKNIKKACLDKMFVNTEDRI